MKRRVVITGMGALTPIGNNVDTFWNSTKEGMLGIDFITAIDKELMDVKIAGEVKNFNPEIIFGKKEVKRLDRFVQFALAASDEAIKDSGIDLNKINTERFGVMLGSGVGGYETTEQGVTQLYTSATNKLTPFFIPMSIINLGAGNVAIKYGLKGPCTSAVTACATGTNNIGDAFRSIKHGYADIMLSGGTEAAITRLGISGFNSMRALNTSNDPANASIPFDKNRSGFVMGEGAGVVILEALEHAIMRGANIIAEIVGYGSTCDAYHITCPDTEGNGASRAMKCAIEEAGIKLEEVSYINAHGTSTELNDKFETIAIKKTFGQGAYKIPVSSTKSMTGHLLGAAGAIETIICAKALQDGFIPPTIGYKTKDEELDLDYVPNKGRKQDLEYAMTNSLGFGGHNATLLLKKWK
ncbi:beta-ketoacyl-ACP synthase II [Clostridium saccharoperbutylacetonicum]|uniref:3-oxoacyl-[acyl-carrier-protein] synthase 2 n=2 Tax=Clostridium TaxID=1485 RepID=M1LUE5_9CLOT|nr:beta-ketoacyl-ACP synthase II [Clostridium saccharoperbutylacetonicum]AGF56690.1 3-oxoacyl-[acyl-carrier-protein] synthase 2 [Clostridium saccharoperbutylacetonicum N1-4(HMT)]AQR95347.1 3-oxoacyl-[acyl-carrier-protein] synthase 2 [Clostridium saccharoperbutylacetonicum]NRT62555.1 3-oxoacyl-[acyl-carrier-protein] synthase II [Clostridium saccharoperbutylacetonicum]NSB25903.1 3-oxoacyl-[acyl-carrier-protein] synthase II [Clostridium saccharoperbutylacetonicum]NSB31202.1 3-oxoacyl-[acyl-carrie